MKRNRTVRYPAATYVDERAKEREKRKQCSDTCANRNRFRGREDEARTRAERTRSRKIREPVSRLLGSSRKERYEAKSII